MLEGTPCVGRDSLCWKGLPVLEGTPCACWKNVSEQDRRKGLWSDITINQAMWMHILYATTMTHQILFPIPKVVEISMKLERFPFYWSVGRLRGRPSFSTLCATPVTGAVIWQTEYVQHIKCLNAQSCMHTILLTPYMHAAKMLFKESEIQSLPYLGFMF